MHPRVSDVTDEEWKFVALYLTLWKVGCSGVLLSFHVSEDYPYPSPGGQSLRHWQSTKQ